MSATEAVVVVDLARLIVIPLAFRSSGLEQCARITVSEATVGSSSSGLDHMHFSYV